MENEPTPAAPGAPLDPAFVERLACPACDDRPPLRPAAAGDKLLCDRCGRAYPVSEGILMLLPDRAEMTGTTQPREKTGP